MHDDVGSAKNLFPKQQRNVQQDTKTQWSLLVYFDSGTKELFLKLGGFTSSFVEITDEMSMESGFRGGGTRFQNTIYTLTQELQAVFPAFFGLFIYVSGRVGRVHVHASLGASMPPRQARLHSIGYLTAERE